MEEIALMVVLTTLILTMGFVQVAKPIMKPLARLLEAMVADRERVPAPELGKIRHVLENVDGRLSKIEERQSFYEALGTGERPTPTDSRGEARVDRTPA